MCDDVTMLTVAVMVVAMAMLVLNAVATVVSVKSETNMCEDVLEHAASTQ